MIHSGLETGIHIAKLLPVLIFFSCIYGIFTTCFKSTHFSKEEKKEQLQNKTLVLLLKEKVRANRETENDLL